MKFIALAISYVFSISVLTLAAPAFGLPQRTIFIGLMCGALVFSVVYVLASKKRFLAFVAITPNTITLLMGVKFLIEQLDCSLKEFCIS